MLTRLFSVAADQSVYTVQTEVGLEEMRKEQGGQLNFLWFKASGALLDLVFRHQFVKANCRTVDERIQPNRNLDIFIRSYPLG